MAAPAASEPPDAVIYPCFGAQRLLRVAEGRADRMWAETYRRLFVAGESTSTTRRAHRRAASRFALQNSDSV